MQQVDLTTGKCLVNEIESELTSNQNKRLTGILMQRLPEIFRDTVMLVNTVPASRIDYRIPFEISDGILDTLRRTTSFTYLFQVKVVEGEMLNLNNKVKVYIDIYDLDTRNLIYQQSVSGIETDPEYDPDATSTFTLGRSSFSMIKRALNMGLRDLERASEKFRKSQLPNTTNQ